MEKIFNTDEDLRDFVVKKGKEMGLTGYDVSKNTSVSEHAAYKILTGQTANPRKKNLLEILNYIESKEVGRSLPGHVNYDPKVAEPGAPYTPGTHAASADGDKLYNEDYVNALRQLVKDKDRIIEMQDKRIAELDERLKKIDELHDN